MVVEAMLLSILVLSLAIILLLLLLLLLIPSRLNQFASFAALTLNVFGSKAKASTRNIALLIMRANTEITIDIEADEVEADEVECEDEEVMLVQYC